MTLKHIPLIFNFRNNELKVILLMVLLRGYVPTFAQCIEGDCNNGIGTAIFKKQGNIRYTGEFQNHRPHGKGVAEYQNGRKYEGDWNLGMWHGLGKLTLTDGTILNGNWEYSRFKGAVNYPENTFKLETETTKEDISENEVNTKTEKFDDIPIITSSSVSKQAVNKSQPAVKMPQTWALAIGVADYENPTIPRLKYPDNDAFSIYAFWKSTAGGSLDDEHSRVLVDDAATRSSVKSAMKELYSKAKEEDLAVFFFSGHGLKGSFLPTDYDGGEVRLYHSEINKILSECPAKHKLVIADACHSGSYVASKGVDSQAQNDQESFYNNLKMSHPGTAFILSSLAEEESLEVSTLHNSVFTHFVLRGLKGEADTNRDHIVTVRELFDYVYDNVTTYAASLQKIQTPVLKGDFDPNMPVAIVK